MKQQILANKIHKKSLDIFAIYNAVVRTPANWKEERNRLLLNPSSRALWKYKVPKLIGVLKKQLIDLKKEFDIIEVVKSDDVYQQFLSDVVDATVQNSIAKCEILEDLKKNTFRSTLKLRQEFYGLDYDYTNINNSFLKLTKNKTIKKIGKALGEKSIPATKAAKIVKDLINDVKEKIENIITLPPALRKAILRSFVAEVEVIDVPSFRMRCTTDPKTLTIKVLLNKNLTYSLPYLKIAVLHEFCGHALEMSLFDKTLVRKKNVPLVFGYAGVSSPNIFDVKAEVFADLMVSPFLEKDEIKYVAYRRNVWLVCRAMADYLYHFKNATIKDVMQIFEKVGLKDFAFDEAIMASIFIDGYQGMYLFANEKIEKLQKEINASDRDFLTLLLFMGKIQKERFTDFKKTFDTKNRAVL